MKLAGNGAAALAALEMIEAVGDSPRALYIDLALPDMPGEAVIASARARWPELPVVVASGAWDAHECARAAAATLFLEKPIQIEELIATLYAVVAG